MLLCVDHQRHIMWVCFRCIYTGGFVEHNVADFETLGRGGGQGQGHKEVKQQLDLCCRASAGVCSYCYSSMQANLFLSWSEVRG